MDHLLIEGNLCTKFGIDQVRRSKDIERTPLGLQTDRPTDSCKTICPLFQGGGGGGIKIPFRCKTALLTGVA